MLKRLPPMWENWVWFLGQEDPLEKEMATHSSILAWRIPWTEEPRRLQSTGSQRVGHDWATSSLHLYTYVVFEINSGCYIYQNLCFWKLGKWKLESRIIPHFRKIWFYIYQTYDIWNKWLEYTLELRCRVMFLNTDPEERFWLIIVEISWVSPVY